MNKFISKLETFLRMQLNIFKYLHFIVLRLSLSTYIISVSVNV